MKIPSAADWAADPTAALALSLEVAKATAADGDATSEAVAFGIASRFLSALAPVAGSALGGPFGALAASAVVSLSDSLLAQHGDKTAAMTPDQRALVDHAVDVSVAAATALLHKRQTPLAPTAP